MLEGAGWICLYRQIRSNPLWYRERFTPGQAWVDLLLSAAHKRHQVQLKRSAIVITVERGQILTSQMKLAESWKWDRKTVRGFLRGLERAHMVTIETAKQGPIGYTLLSISNWDAYQGGPETLPHSTPHSDPQLLPNCSPIAPHDQQREQDLSKKQQSDPLASETGHSDASAAPIGARYRRASTDLVWFLADDSLSWTPNTETELQKRFPARTRQIQRRGKTWLDELRGLSNWHASAPPSKKKRMTAQRWLFGRKFPQEERDAVHAEKYRPAPRDVTPAHRARYDEGLVQTEESRAAIAAAVAACPVDHERDGIRGGERIRYCPKRCGWVTPIVSTGKSQA